MKAFKRRLLDELAQLRERKEKLERFIEEDQTYGELDSRQRHLLNKQLEYMDGYLNTLDTRVRGIVSWDEIEEYGKKLVPETTEENIIADKECRVEIDNVLQKVKSLQPSRERSLAITKLQEGIMWLGMDLKRLNAENPYPDSMNPENANVEPTADGMKM